MRLDDVRTILENECQLHPEKLTLVGVSGGADSLCLLDVMNRLGFRVLVAHFDHGLRKDSGADAEFVRRQALARGLDFVIGQGDVADYCASKGGSVEEGARTLRYQFLFEQARLAGAQAVAVAHNGDDQAETVLMHLLRGAGLAGLKGMTFWALPNAWDAELALVRPFLSTWREEICSYCAEQELDPREDSSNQSNLYFRNRLRNELLPILADYNPKVKRVLWRTAANLLEDYNTLTELTEQAYTSCFLRQGEGYLFLNRTVFNQLLPGLRRGVVRRAIAELRPGLRDIDYHSVIDVLEFAENPTRSHHKDLVAGLQLEADALTLCILEQGSLPLEDTYPQLLTGSQLPLNQPGEVALGMGWSLCAEIITLSREEISFHRDSGDVRQAWLDADQIILSLSVRSGLAGERFEPFGMDGHSLKLSDFWINMHLPRRARELYPLVVGGAAVVWTPGYRPAHFCRMTADTRTILHLSLKHQEP